MRKLKWKEASVSHHVVNLLHLCFTLTLTVLFAMTWQLRMTDHPTYLHAVRLYREMLEYIMLSLTISVGGAFLLDLTIRELGKE